MISQTNRRGSLEIICGSMFSGKSEELIRRVKRALIARQKVQVFKPRIDDRFSVKQVVSHNKVTITALPINHPYHIMECLEQDTQVVAIDEIQFFAGEIVSVCDALADRGIRVIAAGLDLDFRGEPFGPMPVLLAKAERVDKLRAVCVVCGHEASRSQRMINGVPASYDSPLIVVGASTEGYEARCRSCFQLPNRPSTGLISEEFGYPSSLRIPDIK